ncbi:hypothetical protein DPEC_G00000910 [Dallia pectoralis]|uniref:Uncharacterized protein n=1 Tax=Dallia pectoralis TaxID=75939 RepID=A0ACC2HJ50_DALPE|nr:hypothetical protein DPEC_G00000910 [Dallia pectoralis]
MDYSPGVEMNRAMVCAVIKQLREKGIQDRCRYPAQLRISLDTSVKTFQTLVEALPTLKELGISVQVSEREKLERELARESWQEARGGTGAAVFLSDADMRAMI